MFLFLFFLKTCQLKWIVTVKWWFLMTQVLMQPSILLEQSEKSVLLYVCILKYTATDQLKKVQTKDGTYSRVKCRAGRQSVRIHCHAEDAVDYKAWCLWTYFHLKILFCFVCLLQIVCQHHIVEKNIYLQYYMHDLLPCYSAISKWK